MPTPGQIETENKPDNYLSQATRKHLKSMVQQLLQEEKLEQTWLGIVSNY